MFTDYPIFLINMGHETHLWKCSFCEKIHVWNRKYKYCNCCDNKLKENMKEKQKAKELIKKHLKYAHTGDDDYVFDGAENDFHNAKKCALITVNEIIKIKLLWFQKDTEELDYWKKVEKEINNYKP